MKKIGFSLLAIIAILTIIGFAIGPQKIGLWFLKPSHSFAEQVQAPTPDYSQAENWAALPQIADFADYRPEGIAADTLLKKVDVFFIHPTGYLNGARWNSSLDANSGTEENTQWMMANQASTFSDCKVYAPRYREATIYSFFDLEGEDELAALGFAYQDVERAFDYFIENYNQGRPFIISSHSQGSRHALSLLENRIDGSELANRMIATYAIGIDNMTNTNVASLKNIPVCDAPDQIHCLIHWATYAEDVDYPAVTADEKVVCVNPLTWKRDGGRAEKELHKGYVGQSGSYNLTLRGEDKAAGVEFQPLGKAKVAHTCATCKDGRLLVERQPEMTMEMGEGNYHGLDFQLFHLDIRENVALRVHTYLEKEATTMAAVIE